MHHESLLTNVFLSSCKQVSFVHEIFRRLKPGLPVLAIHGNMVQRKRLETFQKFISHNRAVLFSTDLASRGLDFPAVHWVIQMDCPEDVETYIHRCGRTARFDSSGNSLTILLPHEKDIILPSFESAKLILNETKYFLYL